MRRVFFSLLLKLFRLPQSDIPPDKKGRIYILIDGLSHSVLMHAMKKNNCAFFSRLRKQGYVLSPYCCGLPAATTATEAELFFGDSFNIPGFTWYDRTLRMFVRGNRGEEIEKFETQLPQQNPLLRDGSCILGVYTAGASLCSITGRDMNHKKPWRAIRKINLMLFIFLNPFRFIYTAYLLMKSVFSSIAVALGKRSRKLFREMIRDSLSHIFLGNTITYLAELEIMRETPVLFIDYVLYDEYAHTYGVKNRTALSSIRLIDWFCESLYKAALKSRRPYEHVILSEHGQTPSRPIHKHAGHSIVSLFQQALDDKTRTAVLTYGGSDTNQAHNSTDIFLVPAGSSLQVYFPETLEYPYTLPVLKRKFPHLVSRLLAVPEIGWVLARMDENSQILYGKRGHVVFGNGAVLNKEGDPFSSLEIQQPVLDSFARYARFPNNGDLVLFGAVEHGKVYSFEDHLGTHGGFYGDMAYPFILTNHARALRTLGSTGGMQELFKSFRSS